MCNHQFKKPNSLAYTKCKVQKLIDFAKQDSDIYFELDFDESGVCLFHSEHIQWKKEQKFAEKFEKLLNIAVQHKLRLECVEFQFVASEDSIFIKNKNVSINLTFIECTFHDTLDIDNINISMASFIIEDS